MQDTKRTHSVQSGRYKSVATFSVYWQSQLQAVDKVVKIFCGAIFSVYFVV